MAGKSAILAIKIISDSTSAARGMQQVETRAERMGRVTQRAGKFAAVGLLALGAAAFSAANAAAADQKAQVNLANSMQRSANATKAQIAQTERWIDKTARASGVADDQLRPSLDKLVGATHSVKDSQKALALAMDISARTGKPLETVSAALAKGYGGNTTALGRLVPGIDKATLASKDMTKITAELAKMTGGASAKAADTAAGKAARMRVAYGELQEQLGAYLLPVLSTIASVLSTVAAYIQENSRTAAILVGVVAALAAGVIAINVAWKLYTVYAKAAALAQIALNSALFANPIGLIVVAVLALAAGFVLAYKKSDTFRGIVQAAGRAGQVALGWIADKAKAVGTWFGKLGPAATKAKDVAVKAFDLYTKPIQIVIDIVKKLIGWISKIKFPKPPKWISKIPGLGGLGGEGGPPRRPPPGGSVPPGGRGGPGSGGFMIPLGGGRSGGNVYITVEAVYDPVGAADTIVEILNRQGIRVGKR